MRRYKPLLATVLFMFPAFFNARAIQRFPRPEFESGYLQPETLQPSARSLFLEYADLGVLILALTVITWMVLKKRSRIHVFWASVASLLYFGFYRKGCICSIGAIQNVTLALFDSGYAIPLTAIGFFLIPLVFALFFGRTFCAGVCPFGVMQDLFSFRPKRIGPGLSTALGFIPYLYLGLSVLFAATGTDFIICRYDPFVGLFRFDATFGMFLLAAVLLLSAMFIARPYCRFLCPYGVLLNLVSRFSWKHLTITPSRCIQCRLCEDSCPYGAIDFPVTDRLPLEPRQARRRLLLAGLTIPVLVAAGGFILSLLHEPMARVNDKVQLAALLTAPDSTATQPEPFELTAFRSSGKPVAEALEEARAVVARFRTGSWILGGFLGLALGLALAGRLIPGHRTDYTPNKGSCFSCTRCVKFCPVERVPDKVASL